MPPRTRAFSKGVLLDTHIWIQLQSGSPTLSKSALEAIEIAAFTGSVYVPSISVWEIAMLIWKKRLLLDRSVHRWVTEALDKPGIQLLPLSPEIAIEAAELPVPMHKDPADRMIVASARVERLMLITCDKPMLAFSKATGLACIEG